MAIQVNGSNPGVIGRMFARQNVTEVYGRQKTAVAEAEEGSAATVDKVDLSPLVPKPLSAAYVEDAYATAEKLGQGGKLAANEAEALREDRVYAALTALMALGGDSDAQQLKWPGGLPAPTREEMQAAYRRLSQRLDKLDEAGDPEQAQLSRIKTLEGMRKTDMGELADTIGNALALAAG